MRHQNLVRTHNLLDLLSSRDGYTLDELYARLERMLNHKDYCFVALRKPADSRAFVFPFQHADAAWAAPLRQHRVSMP